jgi:hypothetical protein
MQGTGRPVPFAPRGFSRARAHLVRGSWNGAKTKSLRLLPPTRSPAWIAPQLTRRLTARTGCMRSITTAIASTPASMAATFAATRTGLDWRHRYQATISALRAFPSQSAYLDGELCAVRSDGMTSSCPRQCPDLSRFSCDGGNRCNDFFRRRLVHHVSRVGNVAEGAMRNISMEMG